MNAEEALRVGDKEREAAAATLGEHYAAGRITKDEYDERVEQVWAARFGADLKPLFADLPDTGAETGAVIERRPAGMDRMARRRGRPPWPAVLIGGVLLVSVAVAVLLTVPWLLLVFAFAMMCGGPRRSPGQRRGGAARWGSGAGHAWSSAGHGWQDPRRRAR